MRTRIPPTNLGSVKPVKYSQSIARPVAADISAMTALVNAEGPVPVITVGQENVSLGVFDCFVRKRASADMEVELALELHLATSEASTM